MTLLAAAGGPSTGTLLAIGALLATFVAGLFARSILEHEVDLWRRVVRGHRRTLRHPLGEPARGRAARLDHEPQMLYRNADRPGDSVPR
jgi:hypothetical protein